MSYKTYVLQELDSLNHQHQAATKEDIDDLKDTLVWPPTYLRDNNLVSANSLRKQKDKILANSTIPVEDKLKLINQIDHNTKLFDLKANDEPNSKQHNSTIIGQEPFVSESHYSDYGKPLSSDEILDNLFLSEKNDQKAHLILNGLMKVKGMVWNAKGEIYNPNSKQVIPGSDIHKLIKFELQPNKSVSKNPPIGYKIFNEIKTQSES